MQLYIRDICKFNTLRVW